MYSTLKAQIFQARSVHNSVMEHRNICNHPYLSQLHAEEAMLFTYPLKFWLVLRKNEGRVKNKVQEMAFFANLCLHFPFLHSERPTKG